jgi:HEAT repeat protein
MKQSPFEILLDRFDPACRADQLAFFRTLADAGPEAVTELASRVQRVSCPASLKQLTMEFSYYYPWPDWIPVVDRLLRHEKDLQRFETGARALGRIRTTEALAALRTLSLSRATPGFHEIVDQVLQESDPAEAFQHHFARLLQGSINPADANQGAHQLAKLLGPDSLEPLQAAVEHPDPLVHRHALRLLGQIPSAAAATFLLSYLKDLHQDALEDREARKALLDFRTLPPPEIQAKAVQTLSERWKDRQPKDVTDLNSGQVNRIRAALATLRASSPGILDTFLIDTLLAATEAKPAQLAKHLSQAGDADHQRTRRLGFALDAAAEGLAAMASRGLIEREPLLPALAESLRRNTGGAGVASALARLVPAEAQELLELLLDQPDGALRIAALEILGERKDPALRPALLKLRRDAIEDIADRGLWHLGQLPDPAGTARTFLADSDPQEVLVGLRFAAMHRLEALMPDLLDLITHGPREALLLAALETLGTIGSPQAVEPLLALLHSGQGPRIQVVLAQTLRDLCDAGGALALCSKAEELKTPLLHVLAVEALARVHGSPEQPLPPSDSAVLVKVVHGGWSDRNPWPLRRRIAAALLALHAKNPRVWADLSNLFQATLSEKRPPGSVPTEDLAQIQACARTLAQLAQI